MLHPRSIAHRAARRWAFPLLLARATGAANAELRISGSETLEGFFSNALSQYARGPGSGVTVSTSFKGSSVGLRDLCDGRANVAPASSKIDAETVKRCESAQVAFVELPIAFDAVVVIAHPSRAAIGELSFAELKMIFSPENAGKVTRWSQVRASMSDTPLTVMSLDPRSGTNTFFSGKVHGLKGFVRPDAKTSNEHAEIIRMVAADPNAIGFVSMGALAESKAAVWKVPLNFGGGPVVPSREAVLNDSYAPLTRLMYVYTTKTALAEKDTPVFLNWMMERAGRLATFEGFVPLVDQNYQDNVRRLKAK